MKKVVRMLVAVLMVTAVIPVSGAFAAQQADKVLTIAHRGASAYAPENTIAAFDKSVDMKADFLELDVQMSLDGELVLVHDITVDRTTDGNGLVSSFTLEQLRAFDAGSWFSEEFAGERIPTLGEVLDRYRGKIGILIEIKAPWLYPGIENKVAEELEKRNMHRPINGKIIIQSFDFNSVQRMKQLTPQVPVGVLVYRTQDITSDMLEKFATYADYVNPSYGLINKKLVDQIHALGMQTHVWTVRTPSLVEPLIQAGVDGIITDYPDYVQKNIRKQ